MRAILATILLCLFSFASVPAEAKTHHGVRHHGALVKHHAVHRYAKHGRAHWHHRAHRHAVHSASIAVAPVLDEQPTPAGIVAAGFGSLSADDATAQPFDLTAVDPTAIIAPQQRGRFIGGDLTRVNAHLVEVVRDAAKVLPAGYTARIESGRRKAGRGYHPRGLAADVRIYDQDGRMIGGPRGWYQNQKTFRLYEVYAQAAKAAQVEKYPRENFVWGGYFCNGGPGTYGFADLMHMQWGGASGCGTWRTGATGVTRRWLSLADGISEGIASLAKFALGIPASIISLALEPAPQRRAYTRSRHRHRRS